MVLINTCKMYPNGTIIKKKADFLDKIDQNKITEIKNQLQNMQKIHTA